jgi:hypothetical protein
MKRTYINAISIAFSAALCAFLALPASAQRPANGGSGGGGTSSSGGGGGGGAVRSSAPSGGGGQSAPRPSFNGGGQRMGTTAPQRNTSIAPQQRNNAGVNRQGFAPGQSNVTRQQAIGSRQGISPGQRGVSASVQIGLAARPAYRSYPGLPGSNGVTRINGGRPYGGYYNSHGYYNSFYAPHLGFRLNVLPYGYYPFYFGPSQYFYSDGLYYQYLNNQYAVVEPPVGAAINTLPDNAQSIVINGVQYYELNGVYYQPITKDDGSVVYQVAGKDGELNTDGGTDIPVAVAPPKIGDIVTSLPEGTRTIKINGQKLYVSPDDYYYQDAKDNNNNNVYKIVGTPSDEPTQ